MPEDEASFRLWIITHRNSLAVSEIDQIAVLIGTVWAPLLNSGKTINNKRINI